MGIFGSIKKKTIGFWAGDQNNFQFADPLIQELKNFYNVKVYDYIDNTNQLQEEIRSVDVAWFEWGNGPVVPATSLDHSTPVINRIHRYELYTDTPRHINWSRVDKAIFSSPSMIKKFAKKFPEEYKTANTELIEIGVDTKLFVFVDKPITKNILYVGRIHPHKNPSLLLQIFAKLIQNDQDYKLTVIGGFSDELFKEYFHDQIDKLGLTEKVMLLGKLKQPELAKYYQEADFFVITSIIEGLSQASLEAMACGVRPVIDNYYGSEQAYPARYIYNTIDEAVDMIMNPSSERIDSRRFIEDRYVLDKKVERIRQIIDELVKK